MRAVVIPEYGGPEVLQVVEVPDPVPGPDEILVRVAHSAVNRADTMQRQGLYPDPVIRDFEVPGLEFAGAVEAVGERVTMWNVGDPVMGIESGACYAELIVTHERQALPIPASLPLADAAAVPEVFLTAWDALVVQGGLTAGRRALVHAGASGVGTAAIQIANAIGAAIVVTASSAKLEACRQLGATHAIERSPNDWLSEFKSLVDGGVDTILDVVGGDEVNRNLAAVRPGGTIVQVGLLGGGSTTVNVGVLLVKRIHWVGTTLRSRPPEDKIAVCQRFLSEMLPLFDRRALHPVIDSRFALGDVAQAHRYVESNANVGKVLLDI